MPLGDLANVIAERFHPYFNVPCDPVGLCIVHLGLLSLIECNMQRDSSTTAPLELVTRESPEDRVAEERRRRSAYC